MSQASVLQECRMGQCLDQNSALNCSWKIWLNICIHGSIKLPYYSNIAGAHIFLNLGVTLKTDLFILLETSVDVEHVFSKGHILLSHLQSRLLVQSTQALMCLGEWSHLGYIKDEDIKEVVALSRS